MYSAAALHPRMSSATSIALSYMYSAEDWTPVVVGFWGGPEVQSRARRIKVRRSSSSSSSSTTTAAGAVIGNTMVGAATGEVMVVTGESGKAGRISTDAIVALCSCNGCAKPIAMAY